MRDTPLHVIRARKAGFCMGVALALRKLDNAVRECPADSVATLGDIIHNPQVLADYARQGVRRLDNPQEAQPGMTVLIRAHGVTREVEIALRSQGANVVDATCPRVKDAQLAIAKATAKMAGDGAPLLLYGEEDHPEVRGLVSYAQGPTLVFASATELTTSGQWKEWREHACRLVLAAQTTQDRPQFDALRKELYAAVHAMDHTERLTVLDSICDATRQRQEETLRLARNADAVVVVGGRNSGNTRRLAEIAAGAGVPALLVESADELEQDFFLQMRVIALTAGASTPKSHVDAVEERLVRL